MIFPTTSYFTPASAPFPPSNPPPIVQIILETTEEQIVVFILTAVCILGGFSILWTALEIYYDNYLLQNNIWGNPIYHVAKLLYSLLLLGFTIALHLKFNQYKTNNNYTNHSTRLTKAVHAILILAYIIIGYEIVINSIQLIKFFFYSDNRLERVHSSQRQLRQLQL
jgi:hypothetical protein